jgi:hypothetical protein
VVQGFGIYSTTRCLIWTSFTVLGWLPSWMTYWY